MRSITMKSAAVVALALLDSAQAFQAPALRAAHKAMLLHHKALLSLVDDNDAALEFLATEAAPTAFAEDDDDAS